MSLSAIGKSDALCWGCLELAAFGAGDDAGVFWRLLVGLGARAKA